jgi:hypothetical protein
MQRDGVNLTQTFYNDFLMTCYNLYIRASFAVEENSSFVPFSKTQNEVEQLNGELRGNNGCSITTSEFSSKFTGLNLLSRRSEYVSNQSYNGGYTNFIEIPLETVDHREQKTQNSETLTPITNKTKTQLNQREKEIIYYVAQYCVKKIKTISRKFKCQSYKHMVDEVHYRLNAEKLNNFVQRIASITQEEIGNKLKFQKRGNQNVAILQNQLFNEKELFDEIL